MTRAADLLARPPLQFRWRNRRISETCQLINGFPFASEDFADAGEVPLVRIRDILAADFKTYVPRAVVPPSVVIRKDDLVIGMDGDFNTVLWHREPAALNQRVCLVRPRSGTDIRFIAYALPDHLRVVNDLTYSTTVKHLSSSEVLEQLLPMPDLEEQRQIAEYLDRETGQIDALIAKSEQLVGALTERRQAAIAQAVTRSPDPDVKLKDSGDEWIGLVPEHWALCKLSRVFLTIGSGTTPPAEGTDYYGGEIPWVTTGELRENVIVATAKTVTLEAVKSLTALKVFPAGSLVIAMYGATIGRLGILGVEAATNQACCVMAHPRGADVEFVYYSLHEAKKRILLMAAGGGQPNINQDVVRQLRLALPPVVEQEAIAAHIREAKMKIDALIAKAREMTAVLRERRQALISAAVTGKIDVRGL